MTGPVSTREAGPEVALRSSSDLFAFVDRLDRDVAGELLVRTVDTRGVVFVERGRVCWAAAAGLARRLTELLLARAPIAAERLEELFRECHALGTPLGESLVARGVVSADELRSALFEHTTESLTALCRPDARMAWRARRGPGYSPRFTFKTTELLAAVGAVGHEVAACREILRSSFQGEAAWGVAFVRGDRATPAPIAAHGALPETIGAVLRLGKWAASALDVAAVFQPEGATVTTLFDDERYVAFRGPGGTLVAGRLPVDEADPRRS